MENAPIADQFRRFVRFVKGLFIKKTPVMLFAGIGAGRKKAEMHY
jgi:hypothetical protein